MSIDNRVLKFREAIWAFTANVLPKISPELRPAVADIAWLIANHFSSPEDSEELYTKFQKIWDNRSPEPNYRVELLAYCAWKIRLYLTFDQPKIAFRLFQQITKAILHKPTALVFELESCCLSSSNNFSIPKIPEEDISTLFGIGEACEQIKGNLTLNKLTKQMKIPLNELNSYLQKFEMAFGCMVAFEAIGLYWLRAEVQVNSFHHLQQLIERFKPLAYRCEVHGSLKRSHEGFDGDLIRFSTEFAYPIAQENKLTEWAGKNRVQLYRRINERIYQNFGVLYKERWTPKDIARAKYGFQTEFEYKTNEILLDKRLFQIVKTYITPIAFYKDMKVNELNCLLPFYKLALHLKTDVTGVHQEATKLFQKRILTPYFYSNLLHYSPEKILEGNQALLHDEAQGFLYARSEMLESFNKENQIWDERIFRLYVPDVSPKLLELHGFRALKRVYWTKISNSIQENWYNFKISCWQSPKLPHIYDLLV